MMARKRRRILALRFLVLGLAVVWGVASTSGRELRVPAQYPTVQAAIEAAQEGDTILIAPGTYRENLTVAKSITLVGTDRDTVILDGGGSDVVTVATGGALVLVSLFVTNGRDGISVRRGGQVRIEGCRIAGNARDGVLAMGTAELLGNVIQGNGRCGVNAFGSDAKVTGTGNLVGGNAGGDLCGDVPPGIRAEGGPPPPAVQVTPEGWTNRNEFTLTWEKPLYPAAIVAAWYKVVAAPAGPEDGTRTTAPSLKLGSPSEGRQPVYVWIEDELGQKSHRNATQVALLWDKTPPTITTTIDPRPNANGWNNTPITVAFRAEDPVSGVATLSPRDPVRLSSEGKDQVVKAVAVDNAGNRAELTVTVHIDLTKPQITVGQPQGTLGKEGWYRSDVTVPYTATDSLSGFAGDKLTLEGTMVTTGEGADRTVVIRVTDLAGNTAEATAGPFSIDKTPPRIRLESTAEPGRAVVTWEVSDALSGVEGGSCVVAVAGPGITGVEGWRTLSRDCSGQIELTYNEYGDSTLTVRTTACDIAGNRADREATTCAMGGLAPGLERRWREPGSGEEPGKLAGIYFYLITAFVDDKEALQHGPIVAWTERPEIYVMTWSVPDVLRDVVRIGATAGYRVYRYHYGPFLLAVLELILRGEIEFPPFGDYRPVREYILSGNEYLIRFEDDGRLPEGAAPDLTPASTLTVENLTCLQANAEVAGQTAMRPALSWSARLNLAPYAQRDWRPLLLSFGRRAAGAEVWRWETQQVGAQLKIPAGEGEPPAVVSSKERPPAETSWTTLLRLKFERSVGNVSFSLANPVPGWSPISWSLPGRRARRGG